jgi:hypothetical protein
LAFPVLIKGNVDRIEELQRDHSVIDYKTGKVDKTSVSKTWKRLTEEIKNDNHGVLAYAYRMETEAKSKPIEAGIISFKNLKSGSCPLTLKKTNRSLMKR